jgi:ABC-type sulfate transport system substrate-binding protein
VPTIPPARGGRKIKNITFPSGETMTISRSFKPLCFTLTLLLSGTAFADRTILNVSYDPTRELYQDINREFIQHWKDKTGEDIEIQQSHGGASKQTRAVVDKVVDRNGTRDLTEAYLHYLFSPLGQKFAAKHYYRPVQPEHADPEDIKRFPKLELSTVQDQFGGWRKAQKDHFDDGGSFDQIFLPE